MHYQMFCSIRGGRRFQGLTGIRDVVHNDDAVRPTVICRSDCSEAFLTRGIPLKHEVLSATCPVVVKVRQALQGSPGPVHRAGRLELGKRPRALTA